MCAYICVFKNAYMYHICMHIPYIFFQNMYIYADMYIFLKICKICVFAREKICTYMYIYACIFAYMHAYMQNMALALGDHYPFSK